MGVVVAMMGGGGGEWWIEFGRARVVTKQGCNNSSAYGGKDVLRECNRSRGEANVLIMYEIILYR